MREFFSRLIWFIVLCAVAYGLYVAYLKWWDTGTVANTQKAVEQYVAKKTGEVQKQVEQKTKEYTSQVVGEAKKSVLDSIKDTVSNALTGLGKGIMSSAESLIGASSSAPMSPVTISSITTNTNGQVSAPTGSEYLAPAPPATLITRVNTPVVFSINRGATYTIDWGDTKKDTGSVTQELVKLVSHSYANEGDFAVKIAVTGAGVSQNYSFPIRVYP